MRLLLDTHIFLWFVGGDKKLALALREAISNPQNEIFLDEGSVFQVAKLPSLHRDPFDRLLIGQAIEHGLKLVTVDTAIRAYPMAPVL